MRRILDVLVESGLKCLPCDRVNLDFERYAEYRDSYEHPAQVPFETPRMAQSMRQVDEPDDSVPSLFRYFLDGSRRTYKVADIILDGRYLPLVAGQVGVAVMERLDSRASVRPVRELCSFRRVLAFPSRTSQEDIDALRDSLDSFDLVRYSEKPDRDPVDLAVAKIMSEMQETEVETVRVMDGRGLLNDVNAMLVVDGPLRFKKKFDIVQFRNVVGLSKTFRPSFAVGEGRARRDVGTITAQLLQGQRTCVYRTAEENNVIGMWYLRVRDPRYMSNPLQGIVKAELFAVRPEERDDGFNSERIDVISAHLLRERNVTPYGDDIRWASHIYPVYMAESYIRASFMSDQGFKALF